MCDVRLGFKTLTKMETTMLIVTSTPDIVGEAAHILAAGDRAEFNKMIAGRDVAVTLLGSLDETSRAIIHDGKILAVGGSKDCLWFVTTVHVDNLTPAEKLDMLALLKGHLEEVRKRLDPAQMTNVVWTGNYKHIRLLKHLGAQFAEYETLSPAGFPFRQFWL